MSNVCAYLKVMINHAPLTKSLNIIFTLVLRKKKKDLKEKEKGHLLHQHGLVILSPVCKPEIQFKQFTYETRSFCCVDITSLQS